MSKKKKENGSVLILVMFGVLILSMMGIMGLNKTKTEITITRNFLSDKTAFFTAETGLSQGKNILRNSLDPASVIFGPLKTGMNTYRSGKLYDQYGYVITSPQYVTPFKAFPAPPPTGMTLDPNMGLYLTSWELSVSAESASTTGGNKSKKELTTSVAILLSEY